MNMLKVYHHTSPEYNFSQNFSSYTRITFCFFWIGLVCKHKMGKLNSGVLRNYLDDMSFKLCRSFHIPCHLQPECRFEVLNGNKVVGGGVVWFDFLLNTWHDQESRRRVVEHWYVFLFFFNSTLYLSTLLFNTETHVLKQIDTWKKTPHMNMNYGKNLCCLFIKFHLTLDLIFGWRLFRDAAAAAANNSEHTDHSPPG